MIIKMCKPLYHFIFLYKFGHPSSKIRMNRELHHFLTGINTKQEPAWENQSNPRHQHKYGKKT